MTTENISIYDNIPKTEQIVYDRLNCVICDNNKFTDVINIKNTINIISDIEYDNNEIKSLNFIGCENCGCVQLKNLFSQNLIYSQPLQIFDGPNIQKHRDSFCDFIINNINYEKNLFEIGGAYGDLAKKIIQKYSDNESDINYKILEYNAQHYPEINNVEYITGDCELYNYNGIKTIIMSHVFEHLYAPRIFLNKVSATSIENIFISIPDMDNLMISGDLNNLNILHTYYINSQFIIYLFNLYGFNLEINENLYNNSNFYYFKKNIKITTYGYDYKNLHLINQIKLFYNNEIEKIEKIKLNKPFYICPSGFYGQFIYFNLNKETKLHLLGFLDSDKFKINKRLSGTNLYNFEKDIIKNINEIYILISSVKHKYEITNELTNYNNNIIFINI